jgi:hypothetical protein
MDTNLLNSFLTAIRDAITSNRRQDDVALPTFDPSTSDNGAEPWCSNVETLGKELGWNGVVMVAKAGKALKGSALLWFDTWDPEGGRTWENFCSELMDLYPPKKNLAEKLSKAVAYNSDSADSYCEYAREKIRLLRNTKINFTEAQLIELVCGSIRDVNVKMASFNSNVRTTAELMILFTAYLKSKKRPLETNGLDKDDNTSSFKRPKLQNDNTQEKKCFFCGKAGHLRSQCYKFQSDSKKNCKTEQIANTPLKKQCTICKKIGHDETACWYKNRSPQNTSDTTLQNSLSPRVNCVRPEL